jgi:hypothetical protein
LHRPHHGVRRARDRVRFTGRPYACEDDDGKPTGEVVEYVEFQDILPEGSLSVARPKSPRTWTGTICVLRSVVVRS